MNTLTLIKAIDKVKENLARRSTNVTKYRGVAQSTLETETLGGLLSWSHYVDHREGYKPSLFLSLYNRFTNFS